MQGLACRRQKTPNESCFSPSTLRILGIKLQVMRLGSRHLYLLSHSHPFKKNINEGDIENKTQTNPKQIVI